jgi:L-threonylcarbamoyladenylate synthase
MQKNNIFVYPTDTIYGLGCKATDKKAVRELFKIKKRDKNKPMIVLLGSYCMAKEYFFISKKQEKFLRIVWPRTSRDARKEKLDYKIKSTTVILKSRRNLPSELLGSDGSGAVRLPYYPALIREIKKIGVPIVSTSLNISGKAALKNLKNIKKYFGFDIPVLFEDLDFKQRKASQIVDIRDMDDIRVLRQRD